MSALCTTHAEAALAATQAWNGLYAAVNKAINAYLAALDTRSQVTAVRADDARCCKISHCDARREQSSSDEHLWQEGLCGDARPQPRVALLTVRSAAGTVDAVGILARLSCEDSVCDFAMMNSTWKCAGGYRSCVRECP